MPRLEKDFQTKFRWSFNRFISDHQFEGAIYEKISDFTIEKNLFDCWLLWPNRNYIGLELKVSKLKTGLNFRSLFGATSDLRWPGKQEHELKNLSRVKFCGFPAYVLICVWQGPKKEHVICVEVDEAWKHYKSGGIIPESEIESFPLELMQGLGKKVYDLKPLLHDNK